MRAAFATEPLLDAGISLKSRYIQELATKDQFKTMLQGRLASCLNQGSETAATFAGNTAKNGRGGKNNPGAALSRFAALLAGRPPGVPGRSALKAKKQTARAGSRPKAVPSGLREPPQKRRRQKRCHRLWPSLSPRSRNSLGEH
jgi:hypothetical protein